MDQAFVERTEQFLKDTFSNSVYLQAHPTDWEYPASSTPIGWPIWPSTSPSRRAWT